jgi:hypothetical protein
MTKLQQEQDSVSTQIDLVMKNRLRRFKFLLKKDRMEDAMAVADEFYEWMMLGQENDDEEIQYFNEYELKNKFNEQTED